MGTVVNVNPRSETFWGELQPCEHSVQIYGGEVAFMDALEGYVSSGLRRRESVILISPPRTCTSSRSGFAPTGSTSTAPAGRTATSPSSRRRP
jgi:hypothetical protein